MHEIAGLPERSRPPLIEKNKTDGARGGEVGVRKRCEQMNNKTRRVRGFERRRE